MTLQIKISFESANVLIIFILLRMERSPWDHIFNVFFKDANLSKKKIIFHLTYDTFKILFDLVLDQSTFQKPIINQRALTVIEHQKQVQLCCPHIAKV